MKYFIQSCDFHSFNTPEVISEGKDPKLSSNLCLKHGLSLHNGGIFLASSTAAADVAFNQAQYSVQESESSLMVCAEISGVPAEGLECDVVVTFVLISNSTKAGMLPPK